MYNINSNHFNAFKIRMKINPNKPIKIKNPLLCHVINDDRN